MADQNMRGYDSFVGPAALGIAKRPFSADRRNPAAENIERDRRFERL
jgi:hypothetical protein